jgi:hypothetical protein
MTEQTTTDAPAIPKQAPVPVAEPVAARELDHGARIITALEDAWAAIRRRHPDVPRAVLITGTKKQHGGARLGHFGAGLWAVPQQAQDGAEDRTHERAPELFVAGELLGQGGREVLAVMVHEAAHGVAHTRGIADTSSAGRYHNRKFVAIAEELGLRTPNEMIFKVVGSLRD